MSFSSLFYSENGKSSYAQIQQSVQKTTKINLVFCVPHGFRAHGRISGVKMYPAVFSDQAILTSNRPCLKHICGHFDREGKGIPPPQ